MYDLMGLSIRKNYMCSNTGKKLKSGIGLWFSVVVYTHEVPVRATNWVVLFKVTRGFHTDNPDVI